MITLTFELDHVSFKITTHFGEDRPHLIKDVTRKDMASVLGDKDQVNMQ